MHKATPLAIVLLGFHFLSGAESASADFLRFEVESSRASAGGTPVVVSNLFARFTSSADRFTGIQSISLLNGSVQFVHRDFESKLTYSTELGSWSPNQAPASAQIDSFLAAGSGPGQSAMPIGPNGAWPVDLGFAVAQPPFATPGVSAGHYPTGVVTAGAAQRILCGRFVTTLGGSDFGSTALFLAEIQWMRPGETTIRSAISDFAISPTGDDLCPDNPNLTRPGYCGCAGGQGDSDGDSADDCWDDAMGDTHVVRWPRTDFDGANIPSIGDQTAIAVLPGVVAVGAPLSEREVDQQGGIAIVEEHGGKSGAPWSKTSLLTDAQSPTRALLGASVAACIGPSGEEFLMAGSDALQVQNPVAMPVVVWRRAPGEASFSVFDRIWPEGDPTSSLAFGKRIAAISTPHIGTDIFVTESSKVFVYRRSPDAAKWTLHQTILPPAGAFGLYFGSSMRAEGGELTIGTKFGEFPSLTEGRVFYRLVGSGTEAMWRVDAIAQPPVNASITQFDGIRMRNRLLTTPVRFEFALPIARLSLIEIDADGAAGEPLAELPQPLLTSNDGFAARSQYFALSHFGDVVSAAGEPGTHLYRRVGGDEWAPFAFVGEVGNATLGFGSLAQFAAASATADLAANEIRITALGKRDCDGDGVDDADLDRDGLADCIDPDDDGDGTDDASETDADFNDDGVVDGDDLGILLKGWGDPGVTDLDGDGTTGGRDLAMLLSLM
jgi:hypothetical protein